MKYLLLIFVTAVSVFSQLLPYPIQLPKVSASYDSVLSKTWQGIKKRNVDAYTTGMVHRPKSNQPGDAVSEGVSYGMFLALYMNDQKYFNSIWDAGEKYMYNSGGYYDWRRNSTGEGGEGGPASDADQDIALLLIFANELVKNNIWKPFTSEKGATYEVRAKNLLSTIRGTMIDGGKYLLPGHWGGAYDKLNPGYFAPAFYRVFAEYEPAHKSTWEALIDGSYEVIANSPGYSKGLLPDWSKVDGSSTGGAGYNAYFDGDALYRDAIRVYWRLATDYLWYGEPRAKAFLDNAIAFLESLGGPSKANFFDMNGNLLPAEDTEVLCLGGSCQITRNRREHSHLTMGMWAAAAMSRGASFAEKYSTELLKFYKAGTDYWGYATDPAGGIEDTLHNEMYFDQFLAWYGASILSGVFTNVWEDLKDGIPQGPPEWKKWPELSTQNVDASKKPLTVNGSLTRSARWTATFTHDATKQKFTISGSSDVIDLTWYGLSETGSYMPQGFYTLNIKVNNLSPEFNAALWLGKSYDLMQGNRLLVDDFKDLDAIPYVGKEWKTYLDPQNGGGNSTGDITLAKESDGKEWLKWQYALDGGGDPYAALEWNCALNPQKCNLTGLEEIIVYAKSGTGSNINVSVQLISTDFNFPGEYQYFEDSLQLTGTAKEYSLPIAEFKQRMNGSGKNISATLQNLTGIRFHIQSGSGSNGTIMLQKMEFKGDMSGIYSKPPEYIEPDGPIPPVYIKHQIAKQKPYSITKNAGLTLITLPQNYSGATATLLNIKGSVVKKISVSQSANLSIATNSLPKGVYFIEIKKAGTQTLRFAIPKI